jgi:hypothetical protein
MKSLPCLLFVFIFMLAEFAVGAVPLQENIKIEAMIVTKTELRRHMAAPEDDKFRPATYAELSSIKPNPGRSEQPDYLVVRFLTTNPGHYDGEAEAMVDGGRTYRYKFSVMLHFNRGWVEYFIPVESITYFERANEKGLFFPSKNCPVVTVRWNRLQVQ